MELSQQTLELQKKLKELENRYKDLLKKDLIFYLKDILTRIQAKSNPYFSRAVIHIAFDPECLGQYTYIEDWELFDEANKKIYESDAHISNFIEEFYKAKVIRYLEELYFVGKIEFNQNGVKLIDEPREMEE